MLVYLVSYSLELICSHFMSLSRIVTFPSKDRINCCFSILSFASGFGLCFNYLLVRFLYEDGKYLILQ